MNKDILKYKEDISLIFKNAIDNKNCTGVKCKNIMKEWTIRNKEYVDKVVKITQENNALKPYKEFNQKNSELYLNFNKNQTVIDYRTNSNNVSLKKKYDLLMKKLIKDTSNNLKKLKKTIEYKNVQKKIAKAKEDFLNSKINKDLKECSFKNCLEFHTKSCEILKKFSKKLCDNEKKKYCKIYKIVSNIDCNKLDYNLYLKITQNLKDLNK
jgi:hypothetical protein